MKPSSFRFHPNVRVKNGYISQTKEQSSWREKAATNNAARCDTNFQTSVGSGKKCRTDDTKLLDCCARQGTSLTGVAIS